MATYKQKTWRKNQEYQRPEGRLEKRRDGGREQKSWLLMTKKEGEKREETKKSYGEESLLILAGRHSTELQLYK